MVTGMGPGTAEVVRLRWHSWGGVKGNGCQYAFKKGEDGLWLEESILEGMVKGEKQ